MEFGYYPGCALHGSSNDYEKSVRACLKSLEVQLRELEDWICCGATAAHALNQKLAHALPARNLALAERDNIENLLAPCPMCSMELLKTGSAIKADAQLQRELSDIVELNVTGSTSILNLIQVFQRIGLETLKSDVKRPLTDIKAACYYGCLLTRPPKIVQFDDPEQPHSMEDILSAIGAETIKWNYQTECCGAGMTLSNDTIVLDLSHKIIANAQAHGANCLVVACPMCHVNLDMKQSDIRKKYKCSPLVVYYLSDLVGLALGLDEAALGIDRHFVIKEPAQ